MYNHSDPDNANLLDDYLLHIQRMLNFTVEDKSSIVQDALAAFNVETALANLSLSSVAQRDVNGTYNRLDLQGLMDITSPSIPQDAWLAYFNTLGQKVTASSYLPINVQSVSFVSGLAQLLASISVSQLQAYLRWQLIHATAPFLSSPIASENFAFFETILNGVASMPIRWKKCVADVDTLLGQALGRYYVERSFSVAGKQMAIEMMSTVLASMKTKLQTVSWMDDETKQTALAKLALFKEQIGWPDFWEQYAGLSQSGISYIDDSLAAMKWAFHQQVVAIGQPVNRNLWSMTTPTVNAYYDPSGNQIVIPAGILQGLYFNAEFHPAINYGGTGGTMGHEMTHGFDDQGAQFDGTGAFVNWWSKSTLSAWQNRTECLAEFYSLYSPLPGLHIDGQLTNGENIADVGGIKQAYQAYQNYMSSQPIVPGLDVKRPYFQRLPNFDNNKLFFLSYAQGWCVKTTPESLRNQLLTNPHSPGKYRVNGPLSMFPTFAQVFQCPTNSLMRPPQVCDVW